MLPRLPDTALELKSIALGAAGRSGQGRCNLGKRRQREGRSKTTDLSHYQIIAFATHGLVPGELDGLTQPALALTAPAVAGVRRRRPADDGGDPRTEARRRLGRAVGLQHRRPARAPARKPPRVSGSAFFYAGTRALLVTNWSVHSQSARELITDLFRRQADDPEADARRGAAQAMMALVDGTGFGDDTGKTGIRLCASSVLGALYYRAKCGAAPHTAQPSDAQSIPK